MKLNEIKILYEKYFKKIKVAFLPLLI